ncbi:hypothetical protein J2W49_004723 [Hydrogenophaga palleronii]|uniref:Fibronectin type-III domain-containing protein n=1 Tax=Hydrogenophaga palleronii TaxID=65655 RepID=A0ABU1WTV6_9BURK|nr:hypothetical protein [Hydrogenophaga palleronii]MDR7152745.1 hypothetical protein [Hydrogenophaga palleronii]
MEGNQQLKRENTCSSWRQPLRRLFTKSVGLAMGLAWLAMPAQAQETVCARVKIEIKQELTLERQAFDAEMKINNTTDAGVVENVRVEVKVTEEDGTPVAITSDPNNLSAKFFIRLSNTQNISDVNGTGSVSAQSTAVMNWLLIPAPGSAGINPQGKKYLVGARLTYRFGGEDTVLDVTPDVITVKPLPLLTLDYFLPEDVWGDDPLTDPIEPIEPFTLGVRVHNTGQAVARNLKIDSAQPRIVENNQGLLINFLLTGSYLDDAPVQNSLLINFGDIAPQSAKMGRWVMETSLAGKFVEFTAKFTHADELGGALTSIMQATNAHFLIRDVRVDLPGRDTVRDFLARDGDVIRLYESDGPDTIVTDQTALATLSATGGSGETANFALSMPPTAGFVYVRLRDPYNGTKALGRVLRSDAKEILSENVWLSKTRNRDTRQTEYWINLLDANSTGEYTTEFQAPPVQALPPVIQFVANRVTDELSPVSFLVEASSPQGAPLVLTAAPLPSGATFTQQPANPATPGLATAVFNWTPPQGSAGTYVIVYTASDGVLSATRTATIQVNSENTPAPGPGVPVIVSPLAGTQVTSLRPTLSVMTSTQQNDPATQVQYEVFADAAETQMVVTSTVAKAPRIGGVAQPTTWQVPDDLSDNTNYWWRARSFDGTVYSAWVNGRFRVNTFNDPPDAFNLTSPTPGSEVSTLTPVLSWTNSTDRDEDVITYSVRVYSNAALSELVTQVEGLPADASGSTSWAVGVELNNHARYYWRVVARDTHGATTQTAARSFTVNTGNVAPTAPVLLSPPVGGQSTSPNTTLSIQNSTDADDDLITYVFEVDTVNTFDSADKRSSGQVIASGSGQTHWTTPTLVENQRYWWRVKAQDGRAESAWVMGDFVLNAVNERPPVPTINNPGDGAWTETLQPSLLIHAVTDPDGDTVRYGFQVFRDAALTQLVTQGESPNTGWIVTPALTDRSIYYWRARAIDALNEASEWSAASVLHVSTAPYVPPSITMLSPSAATQGELVGERRVVRVAWESNDPNIPPTVSLYHSTDRTTFNGQPIVSGIPAQAGVQAGHYDWDVTNLPVGTHYVYAVVYDAKGSAQAYAPGAVVVRPAEQTGSIVQRRPDRVRVTTEKGKSVKIAMRLGSAPTSDVVVPLSSSRPSEGVVEPASLTFTPENWNVMQEATVTGVSDCAPDPTTEYQINVGLVDSLDPNYFGIAGEPFLMENREKGPENRSTTDHPNVYMCGITVVSERQVSKKIWEYVLRAEVNNMGPDAGRIDTSLIGYPPKVYPIEIVLRFGAVSQYAVGRTNDTVTIQSEGKLKPSVINTGEGFRWHVRITNP